MYTQHLYIAHNSERRDEVRVNMSSLSVSKTSHQIAHDRQNWAEVVVGSVAPARAIEDGRRHTASSMGVRVRTAAV